MESEKRNTDFTDGEKSLRGQSRDCHGTDSPQCSHDRVMYATDNIQFAPLPAYNDIIRPSQNDRKADSKKCNNVTKWVAIAIIVFAICLLFAVLGSVYMVHIHSSPSKTHKEHQTSNENNICKNNPCLNGASCFDGGGDFICKCLSGFNGLLCETNINECMSNPCRGGSSCIDGIGGFTCLCNYGFTGPLCEQETIECASSPCRNGGTCIEKPSSYSCSCAAGFTGTNCEINVDECSSNPCFNGGTCEDLTNGYRCHCTDDFIGAYCKTGVLDRCPNDFILDADFGRCYYVNNISMVFWPDAEAACVRMDAGLANMETQEEMQSVGWKLMYHSVLYTVGARRDERYGPFYWRNQAPVTDIEWWEGEPKISKECTAFWNTAFNNKSSLVSTPCHQSNRYVCERGMINVCLSNPCMNGATCRDGDSHSCQCAAGYTGPRCETELDECSSDPCYNGATCRDNVNGYTCLCAGNFTGDHCEIDPRVQCPDNYILYREAASCYLIADSHDQQLSWGDAHEMCEHKGGSLASFETVSELQYVGTHITWEGRYHILSGRRERDGLFYWSTGTVLDEAHSEWAEQEPRATKDCTSVITRNGVSKLYSVECNEPRPYICERSVV